MRHVLRELARKKPERSPMEVKMLEVKHSTSAAPYASGDDFRRVFHEETVGLLPAGVPPDRGSREGSALLCFRT